VKQPLLSLDTQTAFFYNSLIKLNTYRNITGLMQKIIAPKKGFQFIDWKELFLYRHLFFFLVWRDIKIRYKQTILGFTWAVIKPFFSMIVFSIVFGKMARVASDGVPYPIFSYAALVPWTYFSSAMVGSTTSLVGNNMLSKIYFPRLVIPAIPVLAYLVDFMIAFSLLGVLMVYFHIFPGYNIVFLPLLILLMVFTASGIGMWLSSLAIQYRDVKFATTFLTQLLMYGAPVVWPASMIPEQYRMLYGLYPVAGVVEGFRSALLGTNPMPWDLILPGTLSAAIIWISGAFYFKYKERIFADVV